MAENPANVWEKFPAMGPVGFAYVPTSYFLTELLVNSANTSFEMAGVDVVSGTQENFTYTCPDGHNAAIISVNFNIIDAGLEHGKFGGLAALPNGLCIVHLDTTVGSREIINSFLGNSFTIKTNADFSLLVGEGAIEEITAGDDHLPVHWHPSEIGAPIFLAEGEQFAVSLQDSTDGITQFRTMILGLVYPDQ